MLPNTFSFKTVLVLPLHVTRQTRFTVFKKIKQKVKEFEKQQTNGRIDKSVISKALFLLAPSAHKCG